MSQKIQRQDDMSGECKKCGEHCLECRCNEKEDPVIKILRNMSCKRCGAKTIWCDCWVEDYIKNQTEHNCERPGWRCYGNGPIYLELRCTNWGEPCGAEEGCTTKVNYCPFCGLNSDGENGKI